MILHAKLRRDWPLRAAGGEPVYFPWEVWLSIQGMKPHPFAVCIHISLSRVKWIKKERKKGKKHEKRM